MDVWERKQIQLRVVHRRHAIPSSPTAFLLRKGFLLDILLQAFYRLRGNLKPEGVKWSWKDSTPCSLSLYNIAGTDVRDLAY